MISRRRFISSVAVSLPIFAASRRVTAWSNLSATEPRALELVHTHTSERLEVEYFSGGRYLPDALQTVNQFLRDFRTGDVHAIDPALLDVLHQSTTTTETAKAFQVISGYRSPVTNEMLRHRSEGVAAGSLHMKGQAIDIRLPDIPLARLRAAALAVGRGGVGYYPASDFVHVDTGRVRTW